jgi:hypothetical protein
MQLGGICGESCHMVLMCGSRTCWNGADKMRSAIDKQAPLPCETQRTLTRLGEAWHGWLGSCLHLISLTSPPSLFPVATICAGIKFLNCFAVACELTRLPAFCAVSQQQSWVPFIAAGKHKQADHSQPSQSALS